MRVHRADDGRVGDAAEVRPEKEVTSGSSDEFHQRHAGYFTTVTVTVLDLTCPLGHSTLWDATLGGMDRLTHIV